MRVRMYVRDGLFVYLVSWVGNLVSSCLAFGLGF